MPKRPKASRMDQLDAALQTMLAARSRSEGLIPAVTKSADDRKFYGDSPLEDRAVRSVSGAAAVPGRMEELLAVAAQLCDLPREGFRASLKNDLERRSLMMSTAQPATEKDLTPAVPKGYHAVTPYLTVRNAAKAIEFYKKGFGAAELMRLAQPDGKIGHAEIKIGDSVIMLSDEFPDYGSLSPESVGGTPAAIHLYVEDVDALVSQAVAAGARLLRPVQDQFYGDRSGKLADPFGHVWFIATHKEDVSPEEMGRRLQAFMAQLGASSAGAGAGIRPGFTAVTPYITVQRAGELIEFVKRAFGATETYRGTGSQGGLHAEVRVGNSMLMIGGSPGMPLEEKPVSLHFYVENTDAVYQRALQAGATSIQEPADHEYGERGASVRDPFGNHWYFGARFAGPVIPEGYRSLTPYFHPRSAAPFIDFLKQAFEAEEVARYASPEGAIPHASVKIGGSMIEMGEARGPYQPMPTFIYLYVADADAAYERALRAGAASLQPPADQPYGDRNAVVKDPFGITWSIATHRG